jgi:hypothetical protein
MDFGLNNINDFRKYIPGEGSGKEFLKSEIEKMITILRQKHEISKGVHVFKRLDTSKGKGNFEEV